MSFLNNILDRIKPPTEDLATIGRALPEVKSPFEAAKKIASYPVEKAFDWKTWASPSKGMRFEVGEGMTEPMTNTAYDVLHKHIDIERETPSWQKPIDVVKRAIKPPEITEQDWDIAKQTVINFPEEYIKNVSETVVGMVKGFAGIPFKFGATGAELITGEPTTLDVPLLGDIESFQQQTGNTYTALRQQGMSDTEATIATVGSVGGQVILDSLIMSSFIRSGYTALAKNIKVPTNSHQAAWEALGKPDTLPKASSNVRKLQKTFHPDMPTGNAAKSVEVNQAYSILKAEGIPKTSKISELFKRTVETLESPVSKSLQTLRGRTQTPSLNIRGLLPEQAGTIPTQPFQARQQAMGLSIRDIKAKPIRQSDKYLDIMKRPKELPKAVKPVSKIDDFQQRVIA
ncbi:MAG: J domain-containing protein, partial [Nanoarchaeota archaeon]|nr:J domain-containing protein [Nanoarchaeota archaeon]